MTHANTEQFKHTPWFAKAGAACSIVPISPFVSPSIFALKGGGYLRQLLVECANHIIGPHGKDSCLRRWGLSLGARGGSHARRRAVVAVARKLAVLLHRIRITQEVYVPFYEVAA